MIVCWKILKEHRGDYFVEYTPARDNLYIALLSLTYVVETTDVESMAADTEREFKVWIRKYAVPLMVMAQDSKGETIDFKDLTGGGYYSGFQDGDTIRSGWENLRDDDFPAYQKEYDYLCTQYEGLDATTRQDIDANMTKNSVAVRAGWWMVFIWGFAIPALIAVLGFFNLFLVGVFVLIYSISRASLEAAKMLGYVKTSDAHKQKAAEAREMQHHHRHCKLNPEGFWRLKHENMVKEREQEIQIESKELEYREAP